MTSGTDGNVEFSLRLDTVGLRRFYPRVRDALLQRGYQLTETVPVMRVVERLVAANIERDAKRLQVCVRPCSDATHVQMIDRRRLNPRESLPDRVVPPALARCSGAGPVGTGGGLLTWAIIDRQPGPDAPTA